MNFTEILFEIEEGIAVITLNRPKARNALAPVMRQELALALKTVREEAGEEVRALILTGAGGAFCAGGDVKSMGSRLKSAALAREALRDDHQKMLDLMNIEVPVISLIDGAAAGAGANIALAADFVLATPRGFLLQAFVRIGLIPDWGGFSLLPQLIGTAKAMEFMMLGDRIDADTALRLGLLNHVYPHNEFVDSVSTFAQRLATGPSETLARIKEGVYLGARTSLADGLAYEYRTQRQMFLSENAREGMRAFIEKRAPVFGVKD